MLKTFLVVKVHIWAGAIFNFVVLSRMSKQVVLVLYRPLGKKRIAVVFRGTCELFDLVTDASITQEAWAKGEDTEGDDVAIVHF